jgi:nucleotide-binding universal stress UspA family protein
VPLIAVHTCWESHADPVLDVVLDWDAIEADEREVLAERLTGWGEKYPDVPVQHIVARNRPARRLLELARSAQLVVVGSRGRGTLSCLFVGSVSHALLHHAPCPVAIVRPEPGNGRGDNG